MVKVYKNQLSFHHKKRSLARLTLSHGRYIRSKAHTRQRTAAIRQIDRGLARVLKGAGERGGGKTRGRKNVSEIYRCSKACGRGWLLVLKLSRAIPRGGCPINQWGFFFYDVDGTNRR
jgi:hypothetical protein